MKSIEKEYEFLKKNAEESNDKIEDMAKELGVLKAVIETKDELLAKYEQGKDLSAIEQALNEKIAALEAQVRGLRKENEELSGELIIKRDRIETLEVVEKECARLKSENAELQESNRKLGIELESEKVARLQERAKRERQDAAKLDVPGTATEGDLSQLLQPESCGGGETQVLARAHLKVKQMNECIRKLLENRADSDPRCGRVLARYQRVCEELGLAEGELAAIGRPIHDMTVVGKENFPGEVNCSSVRQSTEKLLPLSAQLSQRKAAESFSRRASTISRPSSAIGHKGMCDRGHAVVVINLPATEIPNVEIPMTAREKQADKLAEFKRLMRQQSTKSNPKGRGQLSLGDAKTLRPGASFAGTPSGTSRLHARGFGSRKDKL